MERYKLAEKLIEKSGEFLKENFGKGREKGKYRFDIKLFQDIESEKIILEGIEKTFPEDGWISEEKGEKKGTSGYIWVIDPLDGTFNYSRGIPHFSVSIACLGEDKSFGIVYDVIKKEKFYAIKGKGAFLNGKQIKVSNVKELNDSVGIFGIMKGKEEIDIGIDIIKKLAFRIKKIRMTGSAALDLCYIGCGRIDFSIELGIKLWDIAAGKIILEEAGGNYLEKDFKGKKLSIATNNILKIEV